MKTKEEPKTIPRDRLEAFDYRHRTPTFSALGFRFAVRTMDAALGRYIEGVFAPLTATGEPDRIYSFVERGPKSRFRYSLFLDLDRVVGVPRANVALSVLLWHVNQRAVEAAPDALLFHASAAARGDLCAIFPAPMNSGKTTLVAGLITAGLDYVTDEAVAYDTASGTIDPYPKSLSVDRGSWSVLSQFEPVVDPAVEPYISSQWHLSPEQIRPGSVAATTSPRLIIAPKYRRDADTRLIPMSRAETVVMLAENSFNFKDHGRPGFDALVRIVRACDCYRLEIGDLSEACDLVLGMVNSRIDERAGP